MLVISERCIKNCELGYSKEICNLYTNNSVANGIKFVYGRLTDTKFSKREKFSSIAKYLDSLNTEKYISMSDYIIMHSRICAVIRFLINEKLADTDNQELMVYLNIPASMSELNIKREARSRGLVQCSTIDSTITAINYLKAAFNLMSESIGLYEDVVF